MCIRDREWIHRLGDILIVQCPTDWYSHPYDYSSRDPFAFLIPVSYTHLDLVGAVETNARLAACMNADYQCEWRDKSGTPCNVHAQLARVQQAIDREFRSRSLYWILSVSSTHLPRTASGMAFLPQDPQILATLIPS